MKLGIFGDSFATFGNQHMTEQQKSNAWFSKLATKLNCEYVSHGISGHSFFGSYKDFLEHHSKYDLVVCILTDAMRYTKPYHFSNYNEPSRVTSMNMVKHVRENYPDLTDSDHRFLNHLEGFFMVDDSEYKMAMANLMISHMKTLHNNVYFYPAFPLTGYDEIPEKYYLSRIATKQREHFGVDFYSYSENSTIAAHLIPDYNEAFANVLYDKITKNTYNFSYFDSVNMSAYSKDEFYTKGHDYV